MTWKSQGKLSPLSETVSTEEHPGLSPGKLQDFEIVNAFNKMVVFGGH